MSVVFLICFFLGFLCGVFLGTKARNELRMEIELLRQQINALSGYEHD